MLLVAKLLETASSVWAHLQQKAPTEPPMSKERILRMLTDVPEIGLQAWTAYHADLREHATEHFIASDDVYVQANVYEDVAEFHIFSRETSHILAYRRYSWQRAGEASPVFACHWVTEEELSFLKTLGASERLLPEAAALLHGSLVDWARQPTYCETASESFGSVERAEEVMTQVFEAARQKLGLVFTL